MNEYETSFSLLDPREICELKNELRKHLAELPPGIAVSGPFRGQLASGIRPGVQVQEALLHEKGANTAISEVVDHQPPPISLVNDGGSVDAHQLLVEVFMPSCFPFFSTTPCSCLIC